MRLILVMAVLAVVAVFLIHMIRVDREIASRDDVALKEHYSKANVEIVKSVEWPSTETCYQLRLRDRTSGVQRSTFAMMSSLDADKDDWRFSGEFASMSDCVAKFNRG